MPTSADRPDRPPRAEQLDLAPHPEGGWYRQTWASPVEVMLAGPEGTTLTRPTATLILFFLPAGEFSTWHRVTWDETWIAAEGTVLLETGGDGDLPVGGERHRVGLRPDDEPHVVIPGGVWQRTLPRDDADALVSCLVSPGFDFVDLEIRGG